MTRVKLDEIVARCTDGRTTFQELEELYEHDHRVSFDTFFRHVSLEFVSQYFGYNYRGDRSHGLYMRDDYHVQYYRSQFRGWPCWHLDHSSIDHIFQGPAHEDHDKEEAGHSLSAD